MGFGRPGGLDNHLKDQSATLANCDLSSIEIIGENRDVANLAPHQSDQTENPEALAGASGANWKSIQAVLGQSYLERLKGARDLQAAIDACDPALAAIIMDQELNALRIGEPGTALISAMDEARSWAEWATPAEHKAYCLACFNAMPPKARASFLYYVQGRDAA